MGFAAALGVILGGAVYFAEHFVRGDGFRRDIEAAVKRELGLTYAGGCAQLRWLPPRIVVARPLIEVVDGVQVLLPSTTIELGLALFSGLAIEAPRVEAAGLAEIRVGGEALGATVELRLDRVPKRDRTMLSLAGVLESGGQVTATAELSSTGSRGTLKLVDVEAAPLYALATRLPIGRVGHEPGELAGRFSGTLAFGPDGTLALTSDDARIQLGGFRLTGPIELRANVDISDSGLDGDFSIDARGAHVVYGVDLHRVSGVGASLGGRISTDSRGNLAIEALRVTLQQLDGDLRFVSPEDGERAHVR